MKLTIIIVILIFTSFQMQTSFAQPNTSEIVKNIVFQLNSDRVYVSKPIGNPHNLSFSKDLLISPIGENFEFTIESATHVKTFDEIEHRTMFRGKDDLLKNFEIREAKIDIIASGVTKMPVFLELPTGHGTILLKNVTLSYFKKSSYDVECNSSIDELKLTMFRSLSNPMKDLLYGKEMEKQLKLGFGNKFCQLYKTINKNDKIEAELSIYTDSSLRFGNLFIASLGDEDARLRSIQSVKFDQAYIIAIVGQALRKGDKSHNFELFNKNNSFPVKPCKKEGTDLVMQVARNFFTRIYDVAIKSQTELWNPKYADYSDKIFDQKMWQHFEKILYEYTEKVSGYMFVDVELSDIPKWNCNEKLSCDFSAQTHTNLVYNDETGKNIEYMEMIANFSLKLDPKLNLAYVNEHPIKGHFVHLSADVRDFKITDFYIKIKNESDASPFKSGEERHFSKQDFNEEILKQILKIRFQKGVDLVYPLHLTRQLDGKSLKMMIPKIADENFICVYANYKEVPEDVFDVLKDGRFETPTK